MFTCAATRRAVLKLTGILALGPIGSAITLAADNLGRAPRAARYGIAPAQ